MYRRVAAAGLLCAVVLGGCSGSTSGGSTAPAATATHTASPTAAPAPTPTPLPSGWSRHAINGAYSIALPDSWLLLTATERDSTTAADAAKAKRPDISKNIDTALEKMTGGSMSMWAFGPSTSTFTTNVFLTGATGETLTEANAKDAAQGLIESIGLTSAPTPVLLTDPNGAYRLEADYTMLGLDLHVFVYMVQVGPDVQAIVLTTEAATASQYTEIGLQMAKSLKPVS
jgi:hypothetical protein